MNPPRPIEVIDLQARKTTQTLADEVHELREEIAEVKGITLRIERELADVRTDLRRATIPPPRGEQPSGIDFPVLEQKLVRAAEDGENRPELRAADEVRRVIQDAWTTYEAQRVMKAEEESKASRRRVFEMIAGGVGVAGLVELARLLLAHHG